MCSAQMRINEYPLRLNSLKNVFFKLVSKLVYFIVQITVGINNT